MEGARFNTGYQDMENLTEKEKEFFNLIKRDSYKVWLFNKELALRLKKFHYNEDDLNDSGHFDDDYKYINKI